jgi:hypothetical protein
VQLFRMTGPSAESEASIQHIVHCRCRAISDIFEPICASSSFFFFELLSVEDMADCKDVASHVTCNFQIRKRHTYHEKS